MKKILLVLVLIFSNILFAENLTINFKNKDDLYTTQYGKNIEVFSINNKIYKINFYQDFSGFLEWRDGNKFFRKTISPTSKERDLDKYWLDMEMQIDIKTNPKIETFEVAGYDITKIDYRYAIYHIDGPMGHLGLDYTFEGCALVSKKLWEVANSVVDDPLFTQHHTIPRKVAFYDPLLKFYGNSQKIKYNLDIMRPYTKNAIAAAILTKNQCKNLNINNLSLEVSRDKIDKDFFNIKEKVIPWEAP
ncbi:MAG: hypothetical protein C0625_03525 [Arcobacter sp.]|nr:MAG: hypothetical protein C0625_03525 [Arcobacter sp.]